MKRKLAMLIALVMAIGLLGGCDGKDAALWMAMQKSSEIKSYEAKSELSASVKVYEPFEAAMGFDVNDAIERLDYFLKSTSFTTESKAMMSDDAMKLSADFFVNMDDAQFKSSFWMDMPKLSDTTSAKLYVKVPAYIGAILPRFFNSKPYMVYDYSKIPQVMEESGTDINFAKLDTKKITELSKELVSKLGDLVKPVKPMVTSEENGVYTVKLTDDDILDIVKGMVNDFATDENTRSFYKKYISEFYAIYSDFSPSIYPPVDFDAAFKELEPMFPLIPAVTDKLAEILKEADLFGDGLTITYTVNEQGFITAEDWDFEIRINSAKLSKFAAAVDRLIINPDSSAAVVEDGKEKGILGISFKSKTTLSNVNAVIDVQMPKVDESNSFELFGALEEAAKWSPFNFNIYDDEEQNDYKTNGIFLNGKTIYPEFEFGTMYLPAKETLEALGCTVGWDSEKGCVSVKKDGREYFIYNNDEHDEENVISYYNTLWQDGKCYINYPPICTITQMEIGFKNGTMFAR